MKNIDFDDCRMFITTEEGKEHEISMAKRIGGNKMKKYNVAFTTKVFFDNVEANSKEEAIEKCANGDVLSTYIKPNYTAPEVTESIFDNLNPLDAFARGE